MNSNDREYAPSVPLPGWLKGFADKELKKGSPFDDIKNIINNSLNPIEAKVKELRDRVGLDIIEKQAGLKGERVAGYMGLTEGEIEKKATLIKELIVLANRLEDEGKIKAAMLIDNRIKKLADEIIFEKLTKMPIMPVEMWDNLMLAQVVKQPELVKTPEDKEKWKKAKVIFESRVREKAEKVGFRPKDIGEWGVERGWFLLSWGNIALGFFNGKAQAELTKDLLIKEFVETGEFPENVIFFKDYIYNDIAGTSLDYAQYDIEKTLDIQEELSSDGSASHHAIKETENILNPSHNQKERKEYAERSMGIYKAPGGFKPVPDAQVKGMKPTKRNGVMSDRNIDAAPEKQLNDMENSLKEQRNKEKEARRDFIEGAAERAAKKIKYEHKTGKKWDPSEMADDIRLSSRDVEFCLSKRAISWEEWKKVVGPKQEELKKLYEPSMSGMKSPYPTHEEYLGKKRKKEPVEMPEKVEPGITKDTKTLYLLMAFGHGLGWYRTRADAEHAEGKLLNNFVDSAIREKDVLTTIMGYYLPNIIKKYSEPVRIEMINTLRSKTQYYKDLRNFIAQGMLKIYPIRVPIDFNPSYTLEGRVPIGDYMEIDRETFQGLGKHYPEDTWKYKIPPDAGKAIGESSEYKNHIIDYIVAEAHRKTGLDQPADDIRISKGVNPAENDIQMADDGDVFDKHPGIKKHIENVCESRDGHIDAPALMQIIRLRPENLTDKELAEIKEYIDKILKERKKEVDLSSDDDVIGLSSPSVNMEDDGNKEVFSLPSKV